MDLEIENRLAAILTEEARRLHAEAEKEGVHAYLQKPNVRVRPNSRFLTATVRGVQQANRVVEVTEMWRAREKELELDAKLKRRSKDTHTYRDQKCHRHTLQANSSSRQKESDRNSGICSSSKHIHEKGDDGSLEDEELEEFLRSRAKRGRGTIGSRMDEPGLYMLPTLSKRPMSSAETRVKEEWERQILGQDKPTLMKSYRSPEDLHDMKFSIAENAKKQRSKDTREKEKEGKTMRNGKSSKHRHKRRREL